jgi:hypothetical protein
MTTHTNCTHPATKAARAACRAASAKGEARENRTALETHVKRIKAGATEDYSNVDYSFDSEECWKCAGSGTPGFLSHYAGIYGGVCFSCNPGGGNTTGRKLTRAGKAAKAKHDAWIVANLSVRLDSLKPGDRFRPSMTEGWKTIVEIDTTPHYAGKMTVGSGDNAVTTEMWHIDVKTKNGTIHSMDKDRTVIRPATQAERSALIAHIAGLKGTHLTPKA